MVAWPVRLCVLLLIGSAASVSAAPLSSENNTLWALRVGGAYQLGAQDTEGNEEGSWGASAPAPYANSGREWVFALLEPLVEPVELDAAGLIDVVVWVGGGQGEAGIHNIGWELKAGSTVVAAGATQEVTFNQEMHELTWSVAPTLPSIPSDAGDVVFRVYSVESVGLGLRIHIGSDPGWTHITLPVIGGASVEVPLEAIQITTATVDLDEEFPEPSTEVYVYEWATEEAVLTFHYGATVAGGTASIRVSDGAGDELLSQSYEASSNGTIDVDAAAPGTWRIELVLEEFQGSLNLHIAPPGPDVESPVPGHDQGSEDVDEGAPGNDTEGNETSDDKGSPGVAFPLVLMVLAVAMAIWRRRD